MPHRIYRAIQDEIARILKENGITPDPFPLNHIAFRNYFLRPAPTTGGSMKGSECQQDLDAAEKVHRWFIHNHCPELAIVTSSFAGPLAANALEESGIPHVSTPQPHTRWWNTVAHIYGDVRGRDVFANFLKHRDWVHT